METEEEIVRDSIHQHPFSRMAEPAGKFWRYCFGCLRLLLPGEAAYGCSHKCGFSELFHKECLEMPTRIRHHEHPSHPLTLTLYYESEIVANKCAVCEDSSKLGMIYTCREAAGCESVWIHLPCAVGFALADEDDDEKHPRINHPSHPQHLLRFSNKTTTSCCDACGITTTTTTTTTTGRGGNSYICTICDYWIHESCALLPASKSFPHHDHPLSLAYYPPYEFLIYEFECAICRGALRLRHWVYYCHLCRYIAHINCATDTSPIVPPSDSFDNDNQVDDHKHIIQCPLDDIYEEIIRPFVKRERGEIFLPHDDINGKYKFYHHHHPLSFTAFSSSSLSASSSHDHNIEDEDDDEDDDPDSCIERSQVTCDGCTLPVHQKIQTSSSSSSSNEYDKGYMSCDECKYFLHLACFNLPAELPPSLPHHPVEHHNLTLQNAGKLKDWVYCRMCSRYTNGLFYSCTKCRFKVDIKCASLPTTIKHAAHPHHLLELVPVKSSQYFCSVCYREIWEEILYRCDRCIFSVCGSCVLLPARNKHRLEKHWMPLTNKAYVNRPGDFYCSSCEYKMNPKKQMYHCRDCDQSFHPQCVPATSGKYSNINFGMQQQYVINTSIHHPHHPLRFQIITKKKHCDVCHGYAYDKPGFQCASCYFVMCLDCTDMDALKP